MKIGLFRKRKGLDPCHVVSGVCLVWFGDVSPDLESAWALRLMDSNLHCAHSRWMAPGFVECYASRDYSEARFGQLWDEY